MKEVRVVIPASGPDSNSGQEASDSTMQNSLLPRQSADSSMSNPGGTKHEGDDDAFTASQIEHFQRLANDKGNHPDHPGVNSKVELMEPTADSPRLPTFISIQVPPRLGENTGDTPTPHIFPAMRERPLTRERTCVTHSALSPLRVHRPRVGTTAVSADSSHHCLTTGIMLYRGRNGVMDPSSDFTTNHRLRLTPRAFSSKLSSVRKRKDTKKEKGGMMVKPIAGRPGIVSLHGQVSREHQQYVHYKQHVDHDLSTDLGHLLLDRKASGDLVNAFTATSFSNSTMPGDLQTNGLLTAQKPFIGLETKQATVGDFMARSYGRNTRHSLMPTSRYQESDDRYHYADNNDLLSPRKASANGGNRRVLQSATRSGRRHLETLDVPEHVDSPCGTNNPEDGTRARTAPTVRHPCRNTSNLTSWAVPKDIPIPDSPRGRGHPLNLYPCPIEPEEDPTPRLNVVHLEFTNSSKYRVPHPPFTPRGSANASVSKNSPQTSLPPTIVIPYSPDGDSHATMDKTHPFQFDLEKPNSKTLDLGDQEHSGQSRQVDFSRSSRSARRWKDQKRDSSSDRLKKWRIRMNFLTPRQGHFGKTFRV